VYVYYVHSISCIHVSDWLTADSDICLCVYVYDMCMCMDTSAMSDNWPIASWHTKRLFDSCFTLLILTLKQAPRMPENAPLSDRKKSKKILGRGHSPLPRPVPPLGRGIPTPQTPLPSRLDLSVPIPFHLRLEHWLFLCNNSVVRVSASYSSDLPLLATLMPTPSPLAVPQSYYFSWHVFSGVL